MKFWIFGLHRGRLSGKKILVYTVIELLLILSQSQRRARDKFRQ